MRQVFITRIGGPEVFELREAPDPLPTSGAVRIRVKAAGVTRNARTRVSQRQYGEERTRLNDALAAQIALFPPLAKAWSFVCAACGSKRAAAGPRADR
jgi:hypothetical protein